jgi:hypothetical protein
LLLLLHDEVVVSAHPVDEVLRDEHEGLLHQESLYLVLKFSKRSLALGLLLLLSSPQSLD